MTRRIFIGTALAIALVLTWLAWDGWFYLQRGYSLGVALADEPTSISHISFPSWRAAAHVLLWLAAMGAIVAYVTHRSWTSIAAWLTLAATLAIGIDDVVEYGTMGSPTSIWTILLLTLLALLTTLAPLASTAKA
jgi:hypothetical protein